MISPGKLRLVAVGVVSEHTIHTLTRRGTNGLIYPTHAALGVKKPSTKVDADRQMVARSHVHA